MEGKKNDTFFFSILVAAQTACSTTIASAEEEEEKENRFDSDNESEADGVVIAKALMAEGGKPKIKKKKSIF